MFHTENTNMHSFQDTKDMTNERGNPFPTITNTNLVLECSLFCHYIIGITSSMTICPLSKQHTQYFCCSAVSVISLVIIWFISLVSCSIYRLYHISYLIVMDFYLLDYWSIVLINVCIVFTLRSPGTHLSWLAERERLLHYF